MLSFFYILAVFTSVTERLYALLLLLLTHTVSTKC